MLPIINPQDLRTAMGDLGFDLGTRVSHRFEEALLDDRAGGRRLDLSGLRLTDDDLEQLIPLIRQYRITQLDLSGNHLGELPREIGDLRNLTYLNLRNNSLGELPNEIGNLINLRALDLRDNSLSELPDGIGNLTKLRGLDVRRNPELQEVPWSLIERVVSRELTILGWERFAACQQLFDIASNHRLALTSAELHRFVSALHDDGDDGANGRQLNLNGLGLNSDRLARLTPLIQECGITRLDLRDNGLTVLPDEIWTLQSLTQLDLSGNQLRALSGIENLTDLSSLDLGGNRLLTIEDIPPSLQRRVDSGALTIDGREEIVVRQMANDCDLTLTPDELDRFASALRGDGANGRELNLSLTGLGRARLAQLIPLDFAMRNHPAGSE